VGFSFSYLVGLGHQLLCQQPRVLADKGVPVGGRVDLHVAVGRDKLCGALGLLEPLGQDALAVVLANGLGRHADDCFVCACFLSDQRGNWTHRGKEDGGREEGQRKGKRSNERAGKEERGEPETDKDKKKKKRQRE